MNRAERAHPRSRPSLHRHLLSVLPLALGLALAAGPASAESPVETGIPRTASPEAAKVYIISPGDGATVKSPVTVRFGLSSMGVAPAGIEQANTGHHHVLIDTDLPELGAPVPSDAQHRHFGGGQTEVVLDLAPGKHTLQLLLGDHLHIPHDPPVVSERIEISVE